MTSATAMSLPPHFYPLETEDLASATKNANSTTRNGSKTDVTRAADATLTDKGAGVNRLTAKTRLLRWISVLCCRNKVGHGPEQVVGSSNGMVASKNRILYINDVRRTHEYAGYMQKNYNSDPYYSNIVRSSKYTMWNFLPKSLLEQFRRVANFYFLIISLLQLCTNLSPTNEYSTIGPLVIVLSATMVKEGMEDRIRHQQDHFVNHQRVEVLGATIDNPSGNRSSNKVNEMPPTASVNHDSEAVHEKDVNGVSFQPVYWKNVRVGDVIKIYDKEQVPADVVLLFSSHEDSEAMIETSSLDGESNLKVRHCIKWNQIFPHSLQDLGRKINGEIQCELPNKRLYTFDGVLRLSYANEKTKMEAVAQLEKHPSMTSAGIPRGPVPDVEEIPISIENVLLRGMTLCNTKWAIGVVVGAGNDTKLVQNMKAIPSKFSRMDRTANRCILLIFTVLFVVCCISSIQSAYFSIKVHTTPAHASAFPYIDEFHAAGFIEAWVTFLILYNNMVPISLYISLEAVKWYQARRIENDPKMRCTDIGRGVTARTSNVNEDLGQIKYIFSDKTGTLTKNQMLFKLCSVGGIIFDGTDMNLRKNIKSAEDSTDYVASFPYGGSVASSDCEGNSDGRGRARQASLSEKDVRPFSHLVKMMENPSLFQGKEQHVIDLARPFFRCLLLCHSASVAIDENSKQTAAPATTSGMPGASALSNDIPVAKSVNDNAEVANMNGTIESHSTLPLFNVKRKYFGSSPDEVALLNAAMEFNCVYEERDGDLVHIRLFGQSETYRILAFNEFDSTRKCMSVIVQQIHTSYDQTTGRNTKKKRSGQRRWKPRRDVPSSDEAKEGLTDFEFAYETGSEDEHDINVSEYEMDENSEVLVFCKGADTVMFANASNAQDISKLGLHVHYFAAMALRTLLFGYKTLSMKEYVTWKREFDLAKKSLADREHQCLEVAKKIEMSMHLLGATGVEDLLQLGVKETIDHLCQAGINIWMLTGDKDETAISVAHMCGLISEKSKMIIIKGKTKQDCLDEIANARRKLKREGVWIPGVASRNMSLVINGEALELLLADALTTSTFKQQLLNANSTIHAYHTEAVRIAQLEAFREEKDGSHVHMSESASTKSGGSLPMQVSNKNSLSPSSRNRNSSRNVSTRSSLIDGSSPMLLSHEIFMELTTQCSSVVACRLSPMQKAQVVRLMKTAPGNPLTLAVGDGGNDVSMIQEAHVGIGIYGHEGMQAVRAADFAIATFRHLSRLLLVHGRWNHRRVATVILFSFYKNMALIMTLFLYSLHNGYSGQTLYESYLMVGWNVVYTVLPIFVLGIADEDIRDSAVLKYPLVYRSSLKKSELSIKRLNVWVVNALLHSALVYFFATSSLSGISSTNGHANGLFTDGTGVYGALVLTITLKASLTMQRLYRWTRWHYLSLVGGFLAFLIFVVGYSQAYRLFPTFDVFGDFYGTANMLFKENRYWALLIFTAVTCICPDLAIIYLKQMYLPSGTDIIQEIDSGFGELNPVTYLQDRASSVEIGKVLSTHSEEPTIDNITVPGSRAGLTSSLISGEWSQKFRDFDRPTEHDELSKQLIALQRELAQEVGLTDPILQDDDLHSSRALNIQPNIHPLTLEFMGEEHQQLESEYDITFAFRERLRVILCLKILAFVIPLYALYEYTWEGESSYIWIRCGFFICDVLYMRFARTKFFVEHYQLAVLVPFCAVGMALTLTISDTGKFAAALYPIALFVVIRVKFLYALILSIYNFAFYLLADKIGLKEASSANQDYADVIMFALYMAFIILFGAYSCYSLQITMRRDFLQSRSLLIEQKRSTQILKNMLPEHVVQRMQKGETLISEDEKDVTILFCDIADFASFVNRFGPTEVVSLLDRVYSLFDQICQKHGVRKMETVGKTYMACAGLQGKDRGKEAALRAVAMALDMLSTLDKCRASNGNGIKLRIGVHSGRVISGLVGMKKQQFSLFGDTVNTASRMQSTGITGRCQVSQVTYKKLAGHFSFEERHIDVKGKGTMTTYMVGEPLSEIAHLAVLGQFEYIAKRESIFIAENNVRKAFDQDFLSATRNKILTKAKKRWRQYDPLRLLLGAPPASLPSGITGSNSNAEDLMLSKIRMLLLRFKDDEMEYKFLESTLLDRVEGARTTLLVLALYAVFTCLRDLILELLQTAYGDTDTSPSPSTYATILIARNVYALIAIFFARRTRMEFSDYSNNKMRNVLMTLYFVGLSCFIATAALLWRLSFDMEIDFSTRYVNLCLDTVLVMFVVSNGGSILHRQASTFNALALVIVSISTLICLKFYGEDAAKYNTKFKTSYPIVLTYISAITNHIASQNVEFFTRRQIWLKTRTQLETMNADRLLYQMLPAAVVMRLKEGEMVCDQHQQVGILFSDIKGFTSIASQANTAQVVNILASLFCAFDKLTEKHGVFKMQTIGDAYVIVSGLPYVDMSLGPVMGADVTGSNPDLPNSSNRVLPLVSTHETINDSISRHSGHSRHSVHSHVSRRSTLKHKFQMDIRSHIRDLIAMARDMHKEVRKVQDPNTGERLQMRIGIHIGNIIGGVIGTTTLRYDMWGPDALTANELESNGVPEKTLVSPVVMEVVKGMVDIKCTFHKKINFTNVSMMDTYLVDFLQTPDGDMSGKSTARVVSPIGAVNAEGDVEVPLAANESTNLKKNDEQFASRSKLASVEITSSLSSLMPVLAKQDSKQKTIDRTT